MTEDDTPLTLRETLALFPDAVLRDVVEDDAFREELGLKLDGVIILDGGKAQFGRAAFFDVIRELYRTGAASAVVKDTKGYRLDDRTWRRRGTQDLQTRQCDLYLPAARLRGAASRPDRTNCGIRIRARICRTRS